MICVTQDEMKRLRKRFPNIRATRTVHKYYVEEANYIINFLRSCYKPMSEGSHA